MLAIRMQRTGRKGHAQFRVIVQDSRRSPKSNAIVALLGSYNPHTKVASLDAEKAAFYLEHGAQPSDRAALLLEKEGIKLPKWVKIDRTKQASVRNADKRRSTAPKPETEEVVETTEATQEAASEASTEDTTAEA